MNKQFPLPTDIQYENFAEYICGAHSWYKHIPLFDGAEFIFFLSENAGGDFTKDRPRLDYAWQFYLKLQSIELTKNRKGLRNLQQLASQNLPVWY